MTAIHPQLENIFQAYLGDGRPLLRKRVNGVTRSGFADMVRASSICPMQRNRCAPC